MILSCAGTGKAGTGTDGRGSGTGLDRVGAVQADS